MAKRIGGPPDPKKPDGRQSEAAAAISRGCVRALKSLNIECLAELPLPNHRRADLIALGDKNEIWIIEIKSSPADLQSDHKWEEYRDYCDQFYFAVAATFPLDLLPDDVGIIIADRFGAEIIRPSPSARLNPARRKAITLRFARSAASRLGITLDPDARLAPRGGR